MPNHLLTFAVVARLKSITKAAELLNLGRPAVSGQSKLLQHFVGEPVAGVKEAVKAGLGTGFSSSQVL